MLVLVVVSIVVVVVALVLVDPGGKVVDWHTEALLLVATIVEVVDGELLLLLVTMIVDVVDAEGVLCFVVEALLAGSRRMKWE